jgi:hypothetical protein
VRQCSVFVLSSRGKDNMRRIDKDGMIVLAFGWLVALAVTLT